MLEEKIFHALQQLPKPLQREVLDFIEYLQAKAAQEEQRTWAQWSLDMAMQGLEDEEEAEVVYSWDDLKVRFK